MRMAEVEVIDIEKGLDAKTEKQLSISERVDEEGNEYISILKNKLPEKYFIEKSTEKETYGGYYPATIHKHINIRTTICGNSVSKYLRRMVKQTQETIVARITISLWSENWMAGYNVRKDSGGDGIHLFDKEDKTLLKVLNEFAEEANFKTIKKYGKRVCPDCGKERPDSINWCGGTYSDCIYCGHYS